MSGSGILIHLALGWIIHACKERGRVSARLQSTRIQHLNLSLITIYALLVRKAFICPEIVPEEGCV